MLNKNRHLESDSIRLMIDVCQSWSEPVLDTCQFFFVPKDLQSHVVTRPVDFFSAKHRMEQVEQGSDCEHRSEFGGPRRQACLITEQMLPSVHRAGPSVTEEI